MTRLYDPPLRSDIESFARQHYDTVAQLDRQSAEELIQQHHPQMAAVLIKTWPRGEPPRGIALSALLGIVANRAAASPRW